MQVQMTFDTKDMIRAMNEVANESDRSDFEIITANSDTLLKSLVYNTPRDTGSLRAGFWPAWEALEKPGTPGTRKRFRGRTREEDVEDLRNRPHLNRLYIPDGSVDDKRRVKGEKEFVFVNKTHYIEKSGRRIYYGYILNAKTNFWGKGEREATFKFGRAYDKMLRKHSKL